MIPSTYEDDDQMLMRIMREACPKFTVSPTFRRAPMIDNSPEAKAARVAAAKARP
jgi:hypothetical protein